MTLRRSDVDGWGRAMDCGLDDSDGILDRPGGACFSQITSDFLAAGPLRSGPVGGRAAPLFAVADPVPFAIAWLKRRVGPNGERRADK